MGLILLLLGSRRSTSTPAQTLTTHVWMGVHGGNDRDTNSSVLVMRSSVKLLLGQLSSLSNCQGIGRISQTKGYSERTRGEVS